MAYSISDIMNISDNKDNIDQVIKLINNNNIIPFIGAGMSCPIFPSWTNVLKSLSRELPRFKSTIIKTKISSGEYEEAAEMVLKELGEKPLKHKMETIFSNEKINDYFKDRSHKISDFAISYIPEIFHGPIVTTNYDTLLLYAYHHSGTEHPTIPHVSHQIADHSQVDEAFSKSTSQMSSGIFQIHGTVEVPSSMVLARNSYEGLYGNGTKFVEALKLLYAHPLLYLGCSLKSDRPLEILETYRKISPVKSYAILKKPRTKTETLEEAKRLSQYGIIPIWYPSNDTSHAGVKIILEYISSKVNRIKEDSSSEVRTSSDDVHDSRPNKYLTYGMAREIAAKQKNDLLNEKILKTKKYSTANYRDLFSDYFVDPSIEDINHNSSSNVEAIFQSICKLKSNNSILLTGEPGSGKSTLMRKLFVETVDEKTSTSTVLWLPPKWFVKAGNGPEHEFYKAIANAKYNKRHRVYIFIDGIDEFYNPKDIQKILTGLKKLASYKFRLIVSCREQVYLKYFSDISFVRQYNVNRWGEAQRDSYAEKYFYNKPKYRKLFNEIITQNEYLREYSHNPFLLTLLFTILQKHDTATAFFSEYGELNNCYALFDTFYKYWIEQERKTHQSWTSNDTIENVHIRIAKHHYQKQGCGFNITTPLTPTQRSKRTYYETAVLSILDYSDDEGTPEKPKRTIIVNGFLHESLCEFLVCKSILNNLEADGNAMFRCLAIPYRHFQMDFLEDAFGSYHRDQVKIVHNNLIRLYSSLLPATISNQFCKNANVQNFKLTKTKLLDGRKILARDQCVFMLGRLPQESIAKSPLLEFAYHNDPEVIVQTSAAIVAINHNLNIEIESDYISKVLNDMQWRSTLHECIADYWYGTLRKKGTEKDWQITCKYWINRIQYPYTGKNEKYINSRALDLLQIYIIYSAEGWNYMAQEDLQIILSCDLSKYSTEKELLIKDLQALIAKEWAVAQGTAPP